MRTVSQCQFFFVRSFDRKLRPNQTVKIKINSIALQIKHMLFLIVCFNWWYTIDIKLMSKFELHLTDWASRFLTVDQFLLFHSCVLFIC